MKNTGPSHLVPLFILLLVSATVFAHRPLQSLELQSPFEEPGGNFGRAVAGIGDVNNDGYDDVLAGADLEDVDTLGAAGRAYVFSGMTGLSIYNLVSPLPQANGRYGGSVAGLGDLDNDGFDDFAVAASNEDTDSATRAGRVYVYSGQTGDTLYSVVSENSVNNGSFGAKIANAGRVDGDAVDDIIIGALNESVSGNQGAGRAYIFSGATGSLIHQLESPNIEVNGAFGNWVSSAGDVNGDMVDDAVVGAFFEEPDSNAFASGRAYIFDGQTGTIIHELLPAYDVSDGFFGGYVAPGGDVNDDGTPDVLVGARGETGFFPGAGRVYVYDGFTGDTLYTLLSPDEELDGLFGSVAYLGDVDQDGYDDFAVGAAGELDGAGRVYIYSGQTRDTISTFVSPNASIGGFMGARLEPAGDTNNDGHPDVVVSATREEPGGSPVDAGRAYVILLNTDTNVGLPTDMPHPVLSIGGNYPNPFNSETVVPFILEQTKEVQLVVYDLSGRRIRTRAPRLLHAGEHSLTWDGRDDSGSKVASGTYMIQLVTDNDVALSIAATLVR